MCYWVINEKCDYDMNTWIEIMWLKQLQNKNVAKAVCIFWQKAAGKAEESQIHLEEEMTPGIQAVVRATQAWLQSSWHVQVPFAWLEACVEWLQGEAGGEAHLSQQQTNQQVGRMCDCLSVQLDRQKSNALFLSTKVSGFLSYLFLDNSPQLQKLQYRLRGLVSTYCLIRCSLTYYDMG